MTVTISCKKGAVSICLDLKKSAFQTCRPNLYPEIIACKFGCSLIRNNHDFQGAAWPRFAGRAYFFYFSYVQAVSIQPVFYWIIWKKVFPSAFWNVFAEPVRNSFKVRNISGPDIFWIFGMAAAVWMKIGNNKPFIIGYDLASCCINRQIRLRSFYVIASVNLWSGSCLNIIRLIAAFSFDV